MNSLFATHDDLVKLEAAELPFIPKSCEWLLEQGQRVDEFTFRFLVHVEEFITQR